LSSLPETHYAVVQTCALLGLEAPAIQVEVHVTNGLPGLSMVGLPETSVKESKDRVRSALLSAGFELPPKRITINLAPADLPKTGGRYDLAIAIAILVATGQLKPIRDLKHYVFLGELSLSAYVKAVQGVLPAALKFKSTSQTLILPQENLQEASLVSEASILGAQNLLEVCRFLTDEQACLIQTNLVKPQACEFEVDLSDIQGQHQGKRLLEICASGRHSLLMVGPPGSGKSMLAARLVTLLPTLTDEQAITSAAVHSLVSHQDSVAQFYHPKLISPHHTATTASMVGGGSGAKIQPGSISLATEGILFLDELPEFNRPVLEALREPLETKQIHIARVNQKINFPANFQLICAMNPSPSGFFPDDVKNRCQDTPEQIARYLKKISGPLMDRIDCHLEVPPVEFEALLGQNQPQGETSAKVRERVTACQAKQMARQGCLNADLSVRQLQEIIVLPPQGEALLKQAVDKLGLSARAYHRVLRVARTLADMDGLDEISLGNLAEAIGYRGLDKKLGQGHV